jgi:centrosomal protein CEP104
MASWEGDQGLVKHGFRVIYCSSEDPEYPVTQLLDPSVTSRGWLSARFCQFPQEIVL